LVIDGTAARLYESTVRVIDELNNAALQGVPRLTPAGDTISGPIVLQF
jgi:hypothetical protein